MFFVNYLQTIFMRLLVYILGVFYQLEARQEDFYNQKVYKEISYKHTLEELLHQQKMSILTNEETENLHASASDIRFYGFFALGAVFSIMGMFVSHQINVHENVFLGAFLTLVSIAFGYALAFASFVFVALAIERYLLSKRTGIRLHAPAETIKVDNYDFVEIVRPETMKKTAEEPIEKPVEKTIEVPLMQTENQEVAHQRLAQRQAKSA